MLGLRAFFVLLSCSKAELHFFLSLLRYFAGSFCFLFLFSISFFKVFKMSVIFSTEELTAMDRPPMPISDLDVLSLGDEFAWDDDCDDLECPPLLASDLPMNSELQAMQSTVHI